MRDLDSTEKATDFWADCLPAELTGNLGRKPTRQERRQWLLKCHKHREKLVELRRAYVLNGGRKCDMVRYLRFRASLGYVEGVPVPDWLMRCTEDLVLRVKKVPKLA